MSGTNTNATWVHPHENLQSYFRHLMIYHSPREIHSSLMGLLREDYDFLRTLFAPPAPTTETPPPSPQTASPPSERATAPEPAPAPPAPKVTPKATPKTTPDSTHPSNTAPKIKADARIKVIKRAATPLEEEEVSPSLQLLATPVVPPALPIVPLHPEVPAATSALDAKEKKELRNKQQKEAEEKRYQELVSKGIQPEDLLTKENLHEWIVQKNYSFAYVARELTGLSESQIAAVAIQYGIKSQISARRALIAAARKQGTKSA